MNQATETEPRHWRTDRDGDGIAWLCLDKAESGANVLSEEVLREFDRTLAELSADVPRGLVIYSGKPGTFVMGADINEFTAIRTEEQAYELVRLGQQLFDRLERLSCPTAAVIDGFALGGGLELAMACTYRLALASDKPVIGLPEVQLGIHPGFGGTVRSVQIAGARAAMALMLTGKPIRVDKALRQGFVDRIVSKDNWKQAAREMLLSGKPRHSAPLADRLLGLAPVRPLLARVLRKRVAAKARPDHYPAPYAMIDLWVRHGGAIDSYEAEARSFSRLVVGPTARNLVRVFFLQNRLKSSGKKNSADLARVHVVGAGVMGGDIAAWCALRGLEVTLQDRAREYVDPALARAGKLFSRRIRDANERSAASDRLKADVAGDGAAEADLVIEAIFENLEAKQALYETLQARMKPTAILATNTSSLRLEDLRTVVDRPDRFIGLHFFNPVAMLPLVEVVRCEDTDEAALDASFGFVRRIGKLALECRSSPGFLVNRVLGPYMAEAMLLAEEGVPLAAIDRAAEDFGMPMGPIELIDSVGLDVAMHVSKVLGEAFGRTPPAILGGYVDAGKLGRKSGEGFYRWEDGKSVKPAADDNGVPADVQDRLILPLVREAVACLDEGIVADADLVDAGVIFGTGFAPFRGGPLQYARDRGVDDIVASLERLAASVGPAGADRFMPGDGWDAIRPEAAN